MTSTAKRASVAARNASQPLAARERIPARTIASEAPASKTTVGTKTVLTIQPLSAADRREYHDRVIGGQRRIETLQVAHVVAVDEHHDEIPQIAVLDHPSFEPVPVPRHQRAQQVPDSRLRLLPVLLSLAGDVPEDREIEHFHRRLRSSGCPDSPMPRGPVPRASPPSGFHPRPSREARNRPAAFRAAG